MGNGHAPGTAIGLGAAGVEAATTGFDAGPRRTADFAVFFFAAFPSAGFLAGFFLAGLVTRLGFFLAATLRTFALVGDLRAALLTDFFLREGVALRADFFFADFFLAFAIRTSVVRFQFTLDRDSHDRHHER